MSKIRKRSGDVRFMEAALGMAQQALGCGEFPVGCVIAQQGRIVADGHRTGTVTPVGNEIDHAEIHALRKLIGDDPSIDRSQMTLYCTLEPCLMCFGAILISGIGRIVYAYEDVMGGGTGCQLSSLPPLYRDAGIEIVPGILRAESLALFKRFFGNPDNGYWTDSLLSRYTLEQPPNP